MPNSKPQEGYGHKQPHEIPEDDVEGHILNPQEGYGHKQPHEGYGHKQPHEGYRTQLTGDEDDVEGHAFNVATPSTRGE